MPRSDEEIKQDVLNQLDWDSRVDASRVRVEVRDRIVKLRGEVPSRMAQTAAFVDAAYVPGVADVENDTRVVFPAVAQVPPPHEIEKNIEAMLACNAYINRADIRVIYDKGVATLEGSVDAMWKKGYAEDLVAHARGVAAIDNKLSVVPTRGFLDQSIAEDITAALDRNTLIRAEDIRVEVEAGVVTLEGLASTGQGRQAAVDIARHTSGVVNVRDRLDIASPLKASR